jgi:hypothetical protein
LFLAQTTDPEVIAGIYQQAASHPPWEAVDAAIPGGMKEQWPKFAAKAWNQPPVEPSFVAWDGIDQVPMTPSNSSYQVPLQPKDIALNGALKAEVKVDVKVPALTREYDVFNVLPDVGRLEFRNTLNGVSGAGVTALVKLANGTWKTPFPNDWSAKSSVAFCTEKPSEDVTKIVLITTDSTVTNLSHILTGQPKFVATPDCLPETFTGSFSGDAKVAGEMDTTFSGTATFERDRQLSCLTFTCYALESGSMTWQTGTLPGAECTYQMSPATTDLMSGDISLEKRPGADHIQQYSIGVVPQDSTAPGTVDCGDGSGETVFFAPTCCLLDPEHPTAAQEDGWLLSGSFTFTDPSEVIQTTWSFRGHGPP